MNAVFAIIADNGRVIDVICTEGEDIFSLILLILIKSFGDGLVQPLVKRLWGVGYVPPRKPWRWRGEQLHHGGHDFGLVFS